MVVQCVLMLRALTCLFKCGYAKDGTLCTDIDECADGTQICCLARAMCANAVGSFTCSFESFYARSGTLCTGSDKCVDAKVM